MPSCALALGEGAPALLGLLGWLGRYGGGERGASEPWAVETLRREKSLPLQGPDPWNGFAEEVPLGSEPESSEVGNMGKSSPSPGASMSEGAETRRLGHVEEVMGRKQRGGWGWGWGPCTICCQPREPQ